MITNLKNLTCCLILLILSSGCDDRATRSAREAADRQAQQNTVMAELHKEVAGSTHQLVAADAEARKAIIDVHHDLQAERRQLDNGWSALGEERQNIAQERRFESLLAPIATSLGALLLVAVLLGFCWHALVGTNSSAVHDELTEVLLSEVLLDDSPVLIDSSWRDDTPATSHLHD